MRPLDFLGRIKVKLGLVIVLAVATAFVVNEVGITAGISAETAHRGGRGARPDHGAAARPRHDQAAARDGRGRADHRQGQLRPARHRPPPATRSASWPGPSTRWRHELGEVDRQRRELVANVSHELRTPITALCAPCWRTSSTASPRPTPITLAHRARPDRAARPAGRPAPRPVPAGVGRAADRAGGRRARAAAASRRVREASLARDDVRLPLRVPDGLARPRRPRPARPGPGQPPRQRGTAQPGGRGRPVTAGGRRGRRDPARGRRPGAGHPGVGRARVFERFSRLDAGRAADARRRRAGAGHREGDRRTARRLDPHRRLRGVPHGHRLTREDHDDRRATAAGRGRRPHLGPDAPARGRPGHGRGGPGSGGGARPGRERGRSGRSGRPAGRGCGRRGRAQGSWSGRGRPRGAGGRTGRRREMRR